MLMHWVLPSTLAAFEVMKSSQWTLEFFDKVWAANTSDKRFTDWWEQAAMLQVITIDPAQPKT